MTLPISIMERLIASTPKLVTMPNGDVVPVYVETAASMEEAMQQGELGHDGDVDFNYPLITLNDMDDGEAETSPVSSFLSRDPNATTEREEAFTKAVGVDDYKVAEPVIVPGTVVVTATVAATPGTVLTEGVDYEVVDTDAGTPDTAADTIRFIGTRPDDTTDFTVAYDEAVIREWYGEQSAVKVQIHAHTQTIPAGHPLTRDGNGDPLTTATEEIHREDLLRVLINELKVWSGATLPIQLGGYAAVRERGVIQDFSNLEGRGILRKGFDLPIHFIVRTPVDQPAILGIDIGQDDDGTSEFTIDAYDAFP